MALPVSNGAERPAGSLVVVRTVDEVTSETFVRITADGSVTAYNGHVDLGTGIRRRGPVGAHGVVAHDGPFALRDPEIAQISEEGVRLRGDALEARLAADGHINQYPSPVPAEKPDLLWSIYYQGSEQGWHPLGSADRIST